MAKSKKNANKGIVLIKKSNNLVESQYKFDIWEMRFFLAVLSQIRMNDTDFQVYRIWYKDVIKTFSLKSGDSYASLRGAARGLMGKSVHVNYEADGVKRKAELHLLRKIDYLQEGQKNVENHEYIDVTVEEEMRPLLLQLQKNFTAYDLRNVVKLGVYSVRLYELLKQYESIGSRTMKVDEMKSMFQVVELYKLFGDFYRWVIAPAEKEINEHADLMILGIEKIKEGKKVVALKFKFRPKTTEELNKARGEHFQAKLFDGIDAPELDSKQALTPKNEPLTAAQNEKDRLFLAFQPVVVGEFGVSPSVFLAELGHYNEAQIAQAIRVTERAKLDGKLKNLSGFFIEALRKGFTDPKEELEKKKAKTAEQKARDAIINSQIEKLEDDLSDAINELIRGIVSADPGATERAVQEVRDNQIAMGYIENKEKTLNRLLELDDFRKDKKLRAWVTNRIMEAHKPIFEPTLTAFDIKIKALKEVISSPF